ncbi:methyl-accepting chemotaxis protein [Pontixanthobacter aquaemixtae]|nr:methyl-accepting chemotaxis protein [Pontixanthobacter aquaemixtae]
MSAVATHPTQAIETGKRQRENPFLRLRDWFQDQSIPRKLRAVFGTFLVVLTITVAVLGVGMIDVYYRYQQTEALNDATIEAANLRSQIGEIRYVAAVHTVSFGASSIDQLSQNMADAKNSIATIKTKVSGTNPEFIPAANALDTQLADYDKAFDRTMASVARDSDGPEARENATELKAIGDEFYRQVDSLQTQLNNEVTGLETTGMAYFMNLVVVVLVLAAIAGVILFFSMRYFLSDLITQITNITGSMTKLAQSDDQFELHGADRGDEIGEMVRAMDVFKRANGILKKTAAEREEREQAKQEQRREREQEKAEQREQQAKLLRDLADRFEMSVGDIVGGVATASSQLKSTAGSMAAAADQSTAQSSIVVRSMGEASSGVTAAAAASDEFAMSIGEISRQAASSAELARKASDSAEEADATISALSDSAQQVGNIVELIHSIAKRTNLLALNASIEAARGGEAGRGFAVVASEVKELAAQTSRATEEVAEQIRAMQSSTSNSVSALRTIGGQIQELESTAVSIASAVDQQSVAGQDLARSIDLAARSSDEVSSSIVGVRETALATGAAASQVLTSATALEDQAATLRTQVGDFLRHVRAG